MSKKKQTIIQQARAKLAKMLNLDFATISAEDGTVLYVDGDAVDGAAVYILTDSGDYEPAPDGTYVADGTTYTVSGGVIASITGGENFQDADDINPANPVSGDVTAEDINEIVDVVNELLEVVREQDEEISDLAEEVVQLEAEMKRAKGTSNAQPLQQAKFNKRSERFNFADQKMKKLIQNFKS